MSEKKQFPKSASAVAQEPRELFSFLQSHFTNRSRSSIKASMTHGEVLIDGRPEKQFNHMLKPGQVVQIVKNAPAVRTPPVGLDILYEDADLIVINKPAGLLTVATDAEREKTAYRMLTEYVRQKNARNRLFIVHRLDRDTSGVVLFAKNEEIKRALQDHWNEIVSERGYTAIVEGHLTETKGTIRSWLKQTGTFLVYSSRLEGDGQEAITRYEVIRESDGKGTYSLVSIHLETGRKNQIRVHMKDLGHPVVGDPKYGSTVDPLKRLGLHAGRLELKHPFTGKEMTFDAEMPKEFNALFSVKNGFKQK